MNLFKTQSELAHYLYEKSSPVIAEKSFGQPAKPYVIREKGDQREGILSDSYEQSESPLLRDRGGTQIPYEIAVNEATREKYFQELLNEEDRKKAGKPVKKKWNF